MKKKILDEYAACNFLSCSRPTLRKRVKAGLLKAFNLEGSLFFRVADLKSFKATFIPSKAGRKKVKRTRVKQEAKPHA